MALSLKGNHPFTDIPLQVIKSYNDNFLVQALAAFLMLLYIHIIFSKTPITCLDHIKDVWPRDGIVRIDITRGGQQETSTGNEGYSLHQSYAKEQRIHQREQFEYQAVFGFLSGPALQRLLVF